MVNVLISSSVIVVSYYDTILSHFKEFITMQNTEPKNEVTFLMALDLDKR